MIKNYIYKTKSQIDLNKKITIFTGANMIGKTRLLETIREADNFLAKRFWSSDKSQIFNEVNKTLTKGIDKSIDKSISSLSEVDLSHFVTSKNIGFLFDAVRRSLSSQLQIKDLDDLEIEFKEMKISGISKITVATIRVKDTDGDSDGMRIRVSISINEKNSNSFEFPASLYEEDADFMGMIRRNLRDSLFKKIVELTSDTKLRESAIPPIFIKAQIPYNLNLDKFDNGKYLDLMDKSPRIKIINSLFRKMFKLETNVGLKSLLFSVSGDEYNYEKLSSGYKKLAF